VGREGRKPVRKYRRLSWSARSYEGFNLRESAPIRRDLKAKKREPVGRKQRDLAAGDTVRGLRRKAQSSSCDRRSQGESRTVMYEERKVRKRGNEKSRRRSARALRKCFRLASRRTVVDRRAFERSFPFKPKRRGKGRVETRSPWKRLG